MTWRWRIKVQRDVILFVAGLGGIVHETLLTGHERPALLGVFAAMTGLPIFLRADEGKAKK
jgi:hypothetical protein